MFLKNTTINTKSRDGEEESKVLNFQWMFFPRECLDWRISWYAISPEMKITVYF
jgi:hypothetical protein